MKIQHFVLVAAACLTWQVWGLEENEAGARRGLLKRGLLAKGKPTTTTTTIQPAQEELEYEEEGEIAENDEGLEPSTEAPASSTEGKKLVGGGVRPFRSNTDLLETLKRRRAQAAEAKLHGHQSTAAPVTEATTESQSKSKNGKKRFNAATQSEDSQTKANRNRFGRPSPKVIQEPESEEEVVEAAPVTATRTGRTFRRGGN